MKGQVLHYDDDAGVGQISGADGIRYNFTRADLKRLVPVAAGTEVDFDFEGKEARDIYVVAGAPFAGNGAMAGQTPYSGPVEPDLGFFGYFTRAITRYFFNFSGRARRKEYWSFLVVPIVVFLVLGLLLAMMVGFAEIDAAAAEPGGIAIIIVMGVFGLAVIIPGLAVTARRLHDIGQSGWWLLALIVLALIPFLSLISTIAYVVLGIVEGQPGANRYGPPVKARA